METREFPTRVIASLSSGVLLCDFAKLHEAAEFLMGHAIWAHHFADKELQREIEATIAEQCPGMPTKSDMAHVNKDNWREVAEKMEAGMGAMVMIRKGSGLTARLPTDGIPGYVQTIVVKS